MCDTLKEVDIVTTRQRAWQRRKQEERRCIICGDVAVVACYCERHRIQRMEKLHEKHGEYQPQACSLCGESGHNRRSCEARQELEALRESRVASRYDDDKIVP